MHGTTAQLFGAFRGNNDSKSQAAARQGESLAVGTYARAAQGPKDGGRYGYTAAASGTFTGTMTIWYSHLPNPDPSNLADWWQDTSVGSSGTITLSAGTIGQSSGNLLAPWVLFRVVVATGTLLYSLWYAAERT